MTDHDLVVRVREAISQGTDGAPPLDLADRVRARARARRRNRMTGVVAGAVVILAVAAGLAQWQPGGGPGPTGEPGPDGTGSGWRTESWHDLEIAVPESWGYGSMDAWCLPGRDRDTPVVSRGEAIVDSIACSAPTTGYGVEFYALGNPVDALYDAGNGEIMQLTPQLDPTHQFPRSAWMGHLVIGETGVMFVTADRATAQAIKDSAHAITDVDANGCAPDRNQPVATARRPASDELRLCRYAPDGQLEQSELLRGWDAGSAANALDHAPVDDDPRGTCTEPSQTVDVRYQERRASVTLQESVSTQEGCTRVVGWSDDVRALTPDVLYWVLSPGWTGTLPGDVPLPDGGLRQ